MTLVVVVLGLASWAAGDSASEIANRQADTAMYQSAGYINKNKPGPALVVLPGEIKSSNATFAQKVTSNNIADFGELELGMANFRVLERADLGPMLNEITLAVSMGDPEALTKFKRGKFQSTKWFVKFDILRAEPVATAQKGFNGGTIGAIAGSLIGGTGGFVTGRAVESVRTEEGAGIWIVGLRYKIMDASTTEQVATGYFEDKMELGAQASSVLGVSQGTSRIVTLDTMAQTLVQRAVVEIDARYK
jgi:hypothetical protein